MSRGAPASHFQLDVFGAHFVHDDGIVVVPALLGVFVDERLYLDGRYVLLVVDFPPDFRQDFIDLIHFLLVDLANRVLHHSAVSLYVLRSILCVQQPRLLNQIFLLRSPLVLLERDVRSDQQVVVAFIVLCLQPPVLALLLLPLVQQCLHRLDFVLEALDLFLGEDAAPSERFLFGSQAIELSF